MCPIDQKNALFLFNSGQSYLLLAVLISEQAVICAGLRQAGVRFRFIVHGETFGWAGNIMEQFSIDIQAGCI